MKTILFFLIITLSFTLSKAQWVEVDTGFDVPYYADVFAVNSEVAFVTGPNGLLLKTSDGGETWQQKDSGTTNLLTELQFPTFDIGYIIGSGGTFLKTTDSGETWFPINAGTDCYYYNLSCVDENLIFVICSGNLMKSIDGGENWIDMGAIPAVRLQFLNNEIGYFTNYGEFFKTENGGETWEEINSISTRFQFIDENTGFYYLDGLYKTIDGGHNFELMGYINEGGWFSDFFVVNENITWGILGAVFSDDDSTLGIAKMIYSESGSYVGDVWNDDDPEIDMVSIHFADENTGYIIGYIDWKATIWKNSTGVNTMSTTEPTATNEIKVYPNPASEMLNIDLDKTVSDIYISLTDMSGKQVISEEHKNKNKISIDTTGLPKGIYMLSIRMKQKMVNRKIIIN